MARSGRQTDSGRCDTRLPFRRFLRLAASCGGQRRESWRGPKIVEVNWRRPGRWWRRQLPTAIRRVGFRSLSSDDQIKKRRAMAALRSNSSQPALRFKINQL